jgi:light-regulated signal transduction histidine kinase (bacteriophytochrome)
LIGLSILAVVALLVIGLGVRNHFRQISDWQRRERDLLRTMREQECARHQLELANRTLERRAKQLARSNAELERFAHVASHDLKEPVRTVVSYTQLLARKYAGQLDAEAQEYIRDAAEAARSIRSRIESLLDFSVTGDQSEAFVRVDSRSGVDKAMANLRPAIADTGALIHCDALPTVLGHPPEITLLFQNLLDNAIKFRSGQPPEIRVTAQRAENPAEWQFSISDNGIGIDPRSAEKLFGLFQRVHPQHKVPGMGMGLAVSRKIVESHGGRIWYEPNAGGGSRFLFTLPAPPA